MPEEVKGARGGEKAAASSDTANSASPPAAETPSPADNTRPPPESASSSTAPLDDVFASFMSEVQDAEREAEKQPKKKKITKLPSFLFPGAKKDVVIAKDKDAQAAAEQGILSDSLVTFSFGKADEECERLTSKIFTNSYEVLKLPPGASEEIIKKAFRKISLLIHPDKCKHPRAAQAFHVVNKANEELGKAEMKEKYKHVICEARKRVLHRRTQENKILAKMSEPLLSVEEEDIQEEIIRTCDTLLQNILENIDYAERCRKSNEEWERKAEEALLEDMRKEEELKRKWAASRDHRVGDWREYKDDLAAKRLKTEAFKPVTHQREVRKHKDKSIHSKPLGIDESYKLNWR